MSYIILGGAASILLLGIALTITIKVASARGKKNAELQIALNTAQEQLKKQKVYQEKREEAQQNADTKKETLHTGDTAADFNNSLGVLNSASKNRNG